jgi:demethylmenaquinone methyltransferase/2-methoxy-6-polyprenyl-1,4-benzoquinol methylase
MEQDTLSSDSAKRIYNLLGPFYEWFEFYEGQAKSRALELLQLAPGQSVLNAGMGTGKQHLEIQTRIGPNGVAHGFDLSPRMAHIAHARAGSPVCEADVHHLPYASQGFDRLYSAFVLDLIPSMDLLSVLAEYKRVIKPDGLAVVLSMTEGVSLPSKAFVSAWKLAYAVSPFACAGCRPLELLPLAEKAGFRSIRREVIVQLGVPSEILVAQV